QGADLRELMVTPSAFIAHIPETCAAQDSSRLNNESIAQCTTDMDGNVVSDVAVLTNQNSGLDYAIRAYLRLVADANLLSNYAVSSHSHILSDIRGRMNICRGMDI